MTKTQPHPDADALRQRLKDALPERIGKAMTDYDAFHLGDPPADAKGFAAHHAACRAALAHIDMLTKLLVWANGDEEAPDPSDSTAGVGDLIAQARAAIGEVDDDETDDD